MSDTQNTATTQTPAESNPNLNIADLVNVLQIINTCSSRGAFQASEMSSVGGLYDRLHSFLVATGAFNQNESAAADQPDTAKQ